MENSSYHNDIIKGFDFNREDFKSPAKRNLMIGAEEADYVILADENVTSEEEIRQIITENDFLLDYGMVVFGENVPDGEIDFNNIIDYFKMNVYGVLIKKSILVYTGCYNEELTAGIDYELAVRVAYYAEKYGTVDVVVNNAQAIVPSAPVEETSYDNMLKAWQSGVIGSLNYMQAAFPYMKEQHEGRIINFASATGMFGIAGQLAYGSNKEALRGMTKIAAKEWGQYGICVNIVLPGAESPAAKAWAEKFPEEYAKQVNLNPMKRFGDPETDIAPVIAFLAGPDSCYFSGQSVIVDGANSIMP